MTNPVRRVHLRSSAQNSINDNSSSPSAAPAGLLLPSGSGFRTKAGNSTSATESPQSLSRPSELWSSVENNGPAASSQRQSPYNVAAPAHSLSHPTKADQSKKRPSGAAYRRAKKQRIQEEAEKSAREKQPLRAEDENQESTREEGQGNGASQIQRRPARNRKTARKTRAGTDDASSASSRPVWDVDSNLVEQYLPSTARISPASRQLAEQQSSEKNWNELESGGDVDSDEDPELLRLFEEAIEEQTSQSASNSDLDEAIPAQSDGPAGASSAALTVGDTADPAAAQPRRRGRERPRKIQPHPGVSEKGQALPSSYTANIRVAVARRRAQLETDLALHRQWLEEARQEAGLLETAKGVVDERVIHLERKRRLRMLREKGLLLGSGSTDNTTSPGQ